MTWIIIAVTMTIAVFFLCGYTYRICFHVTKKHFEDPYQQVDEPQFKAVQHLMDRSTKIVESTVCEEVTTTAFDGLTLHARYYAIAENAPLMIVFHGYRSTALRDCAGALALSLKLGYNVLAVDQRAHGKSEGRVISFGILERYDCLSWIHYANQRFGTDIPIALTGISMGAATVLMACSLELPANVRGILADCPYSAPSAIIRKVCKDIGYPSDIVYPFVWLGAILFGHFRLDTCNAKDAVQHANIPILLIHGEDDRFVPCDMSVEIAQHCHNAQLFTFPNAGHGLSYLMDQKRYEQICSQFLADIF